MYWTLRFTKSSEAGVNPNIRLQEVYYDDNDAPLGHADPFLYGESADWPHIFAVWVAQAAALPVLDEEDIP